MFQYTYQHADYNIFLAKFAEALGVAIDQNNTLRFPESIANGYFHVLTIANGLQAMILDVTLNQDLLIVKQKNKEEYYTLRVDEIHISKSLNIVLDDDVLEEKNYVHSAAVLTSSHTDLSLQASKGTKVQGVYIALSKEWLARYLGIESGNAILKKYLRLKTGSFNLQPFDEDYRQCLYEIINADNISPLKSGIIQNRLMFLIEKFFTGLFQKLTSKKQIKISDEELQRLMTVEALLVNDFSTDIPPLAKLAQMAAMSETRFKTLFKEVYHSSAYGYFQKNRMLRAKSLLATHNFSVQEIGRQLGYQNLSNFTLAFKKEFRILPSEV